MKLTKKTRIHLYREMLRLRRFEEHVRDLFAAGRLPGFVHLYLGEEAIAVGACAATNPDDYLTSTHRGHGHVLAKGGDPKRMFAELYAKVTGYNKAKGGSMHLAAPELGILGANGIVGGGLPLAAGAGMTSKMRKDGRLCLCFFGDAASNQGTFHESINISASYDLPVIYICENNMYGGGVKQHEDGRFVNADMDYPRKVADIASRAVGYGIPGEVVDGMDVEAVHRAVRTAADRARRGEGPTLLECKTYRWRTHFEGEPDSYRPPDEVSEWRTRCPLDCYADKLLAEKVLTQADIARIKAEVETEMLEAIRFGEESPEPDLEDALKDVFA